MKTNLIACAVIFVSFGACQSDEGFNQTLIQGDSASTPAFAQSEGKTDHVGLRSYVAVANRGDSTIAILDNRDQRLLGHITEAQVGFEFEPTYVAKLDKSDLLTVSDRKNSRVLIFDSRTLQFFGYIPASQGLFHMWPSPNGERLFVVADGDDVVDMITIERKRQNLFYSLDSFDVGAEIIGGNPHDVVADDNYFYVTVQQNEAEKDTVLKVNQDNFAVEGKLDFSLDTHLGMPSLTPFLLVPEQSGGNLNFVNRNSFEIVSRVDNVPGAHGIFWDNLASRIFLANTPSDGIDSVFEIQRTPGAINPSLVGSLDLGLPKAHNIAVDFSNERAYITHSGAESSTLAVANIDGDMSLEHSIEVGLNPFGIAYIENN